jgi:hypothetical protein
MNKNFDPAIGRATCWRKGQPSPNPAGRPRKTMLTDALRDVLAQPFPGDGQRRTFAEVIARRIATEAARGNLRAVAEIADRTEGRTRLESESQANDRTTPALLPPENTRDVYQSLKELTERLRRRIELRRAARALEDATTPAN